MVFLDARCYTKSTYNIVQNILYERLVNAVGVAVIDQWSNTELDYYRYLYGIVFENRISL